jgi:recombination protein RecR
MQYPPHLIKLIETLKQLPGVGTRSAERFAFHLLSTNKEQLEAMGQIIAQIPEKIHCCPICGVFQDEKGCLFCQDPLRDKENICIVARAKDAFAVEKTGEFKGVYHVLGTLLSPMQGIGPEKLNLQKLIHRIKDNGAKEAVLALDSTLEGDATALYLRKELTLLGLKLSRLAFGMPIGSSFDFVDGGTLAKAFSGRGPF